MIGGKCSKYATQMGGQFRICLAVQCLFGPLPSPSPHSPPSSSFRFRRFVRPQKPLLLLLLLLRLLLFAQKREIGGQRRKRMSEGKTDRQAGRHSQKEKGAKNISIIRATHSLTHSETQRLVTNRRWDGRLLPQRQILILIAVRARSLSLRRLISRTATGPSLVPPLLFRWSRIF